MTTTTTHTPFTLPLVHRTASAPRGARAVATLAVAAPVGLATAVAIHPPDTHDAAATLARIAGDDRARWALTHVLEPVAWLALAAVLLLAGRVTRGKGRTLVRTGAGLGAVGAAASALIVYSHGEAFMFMTDVSIDRAAMEPLYSHYQQAMPLVAPLTLAFRLGVLLLGIGLFRSGAVPRWAAVALAVVPFAMIPAAAAPSVVTAVLAAGPLVVGLAGSARAIGEAAISARTADPEGVGQ